MLHVGAVALLTAAVVLQPAVGFVASAGELVLHLLLAGTAAAARPSSSRAVAITAGTVGFIAVLLTDPAMESLQSALLAVVMFGAAVGAGLALRHRAAAGEAHARETDQRAARLLEEERCQIVKELHVVVTRSLSVVVVQAGSARLDVDPEQAAHLAAIETTARSALDEMRRLLGVLRGTDDAELQPGLDQLPAPVEQVTRSGLNVALQHDEDRQPLPPGLDLAACRVVQESLTNVLRHARARQAEVRLMVSAGPGPQGGFAVRAELPLLWTSVPTP